MQGINVVTELRDRINKMTIDCVTKLDDQGRIASAKKR